MRTRLAPLLPVLLLAAAGCNEDDPPRGGGSQDNQEDAAASSSGDAGMDAQADDPSDDDDAMDASASDAAVMDASVEGDASASDDASALDATTDDASVLEDASSSDAGDADAPSDADASCVPGESTPVDLVLAFDTSGSMADTVCSVASTVADFEDNLPDYIHLVAVYSVTDAAAFNFTASAQLLCGSADPIADALVASSERYLHVNAMVNSNDAFQVLLNSFDSYKNRLRAGARTHFLTVSDDDIVGMTAVTFKDQMAAKLGHAFTYHALAGGPCPGASATNAHFVLADLTGGKKYSICEDDYADDLADLESVITAPSCE